MASFTVRVELHQGSLVEYERLHLAMAKVGFLRSITSDDGTRYLLPTAEYNYEGIATVEQIVNMARGAVNMTGRAAGVLVTEALRRSWVGLPFA